jgi:hypothetical protein
LGGDLMDAVSLKLARNYTNEKLNSLPSNAPTKTVTFDGGIYRVDSDVVNGQVSDIRIKGQTWTNLAGAGDTSPQTVENLDAAKTYLLINSAGANVTIDTIDTPTPVKLTGDTEFDFVWASGKIALYELSAEETALDASVLGQKYHYVSDTKSTVSAMRLKSVGKNLFDGDNAPSYVHRTCIYTKIDNGFNLSGSWYAMFSIKPLKKNTYYTLSATTTTITGTPATKWTYGHTDGTFAPGYTDIGSRRITDVSKTVDRVFVYVTIADDVTASCDYTNIQLEEASTATPYEPYTESTQYLPNVGELRSLPNGVKDEINVTSGIKTQGVGNKTNVASGTVINYTDMATAGQFEAWGSGEHVVGVKGDTLAFTATSLNYQLATPIVTKLPAQAPLQVFENGTVYAEPIGDPSETTLPTVELTVPIGAPNKFGSASHDYEGAAADWVLNDSEQKCLILVATNSGGNANIILPKKSGLVYLVDNKTDYNIVCKSVGDVAGTTILSGNSGLIYNI